MRKLLFWAAIAMLLLTPLAFGQSRNASLSGTVEDAQGGVLPGVEITATNNATGVVSTQLTNDVGVYNFPSLTAGTYTVKADLPSFQTTSFKDVLLGSAAQVRLNIKMQVAGLEETVEVSVDADQLLLESSSSVGDVLTQTEVEDLPRVNNNVLDLVKIMAGANISDDPIFGEASGTGGGQTTFAGVSSSNININVNGVPVSDVRQPAGVNSPTRLNPDLVGEFRIVLAPVDAEYGRGNGQIQVTTRSGSNQYHGSAAWNIQNTALDPNTWSNNHTPGTTVPWRNLNEGTVSFSGPIIQNKTFFFVLYNQQDARSRSDVEAIALTKCARKGIYRWFEGWNNGPYLSATVGGWAPATAVVDVAGNPVAPAGDEAGLQYQSVFGPLTQAARDAIASDPVNCSNYDFDPSVADFNVDDVDSYGISSFWDPDRHADRTGFIAKFITAMPLPNEFEVGDGLNSGGIRWNRTLKGADNLYGVGEDTERKQINARIDHNFNDKHRISGNMSFERNKADDTFATWPQNSWPGAVRRQPAVYSVNFTSSITPTLLNEVNFGVSRTGTNVYTPLSNPDTTADVQAFFPKIDGVTVIVGPGGGSWFLSPFYFQPDGAFGGRGYPSGPYGSRGFVIGDLWDSSPRWTIGDTVSWAKGAHSFKWGGEYRLNNSFGASGWSFEWATFSSFVSNPYASGGQSPYSPVQGINALADPTNFPGLIGSFFGNENYMKDLLNFHSGSLGNIRQQNYINSPDQVASGEWADQTKETLPIRDFGQNELSFFFKDDWKVHPDLTLNLGIRYDYYGVPFLRNGMTTSFVGGAGAIYGISGRSWNEAFWQPAEVRAEDTRVIFVGPDSPHPNQKLYNRDLNNFGPAVGFSYTLPWLGKGKTTIRGGYQISYLAIGRVSEVASYVGASTPGSVYNDTYYGDAVTNPYLDLTDLTARVPVPAGIVPLAPIPNTDRLQDIGTFDPNIRSPYVQNLTLAITRNVTSQLTVDVRYIGTLSRKMYQNINVNTPNFLTNGLKEAFDVARYGYENLPEFADQVALLDTFFSQAPDYENYNGGADYLRRSNVNGGGTGISDSLANGDYQNIATQMNLLGTQRGDYLRDSGLGDNFIKANPQFNSATLRTNGGHSNYHSLQAQVTLRPLYGFSLQATYTLSKNLGVFTSTPTNPLNPSLDYTRSGSDRTHVLSTYGAMDLPFGPNKRFFNSTNSVVAQIIEGWQLNWIANVSSGRPANISARNMLYANGVPDIVGDFNVNDAGVVWEDGSLRGNYFGRKYMLSTDPQCSMIQPDLASRCTMKAAYLVDGYAEDGSPIAGDLVLKNPMPGEVGSLGHNKFNGPRVWSVDMSMAKSFTVAEGKKISFRMDASNIFNHSQPSYGIGISGTRLTYANLPNLDINSSSENFLGELNNKAGNRTFQFMLRFDF